MRQNTTKWLLRFVLLVFTVSAAFFVFWLYQPTDVLTLTAPVTVEPPIASSGAPVVLTISYCKHIKINGTVRISFVSRTAEIFTPMAPEQEPSGCYKDIKFPLLLPPASLVPPGTYMIKFHATWKVNPLSTVTKDYYTQSFTIK